MFLWGSEFYFPALVTPPPTPAGSIRIRFWSWGQGRRGVGEGKERGGSSGLRGIAMGGELGAASWLRMKRRWWCRRRWLRRKTAGRDLRSVEEKRGEGRGLRGPHGALTLPASVATTQWAVVARIPEDEGGWWLDLSSVLAWDGGRRGVRLRALHKS